MTLSFYQSVLPPDGAYCAVGIKDGKVITTFHNTLDALIARGAVLYADQQNAFFALAAFNDPFNGRKADNARAFRAFFIDLDCGAGKQHATRESAAVALGEFVSTTQLPAPYVVNSGRGIHAYWALTEAIPTAEWYPLARALKQLCVTHRLGIDLSVTADAARVLRMVDTENHKDVPPKPVQIMAEGIPAPVSEFYRLLPVLPTPVDLSAAKAYGVDAMTQALAGGTEFPASEFSRIARRSLRGTGCAQIANAIQNAATLEEPLWRAALSIAWRCTDAEKAIHTLSRAHPGYTAEATIHKAESTQGPMTCDWYRANYSATCVGCSQKCQSPIALGRKMEAAEAVNDVYVVAQQLEPDNTELATPHTVQVEIPAYPFPYFRGIHGGVYMKSKDKEGDPIELEIYKYDLYLTSRFYDSTEQGDGEGELVGVNLHTPHDGIRRFIAPVVSLLTKEKMRDLLLKHGVVAINRELDNIMAYMAASTRNLQKLFAADRTRNQMGWTHDDSGFVVGELEYTEHGARLAPAASATRAMAPMLMAKGDLTKWSAIANFYNRPGMEAHALALLFGFGAPLLRLIGGMEVRGAAINLMSNKSGTGKTTAQMVINSIFGHPNNLLMKKSDTMMAKMQWLGTLNSMAATMDEVTNVSDEELSELIYDIPQGRGKHRMESQTNKLRTNITSWMTFVVMSSNSSLYDKLVRLKSTSDGELRRLIELRITRPVEVSKQESDAVFGALSENYGLAGPVFIQHVIKNRESVIAQLRRLQSRVDTDLNLNQSDRFFSTVLACAFAGGSIASKLGLIGLDLTRIYTYALSVVSGIRADVIAPASDSALAAKEALTTYINENLSNTLVINGSRVSGAPTAPIMLPRGPLRVRYEPDTRELWIPSTALRDYFVARQVDVQYAVKELATLGVFKFKGIAQTKRIGAGALGSFDALGVRSYCIDGAAVGVTETAFVSPADAVPST